MNDAVLARVEATAREHGFSGVVAAHAGERTLFERAFGHAHRAHSVPNEPHTAFGIASGSKAFTALAVMSLVEAGKLALDQPVRQILGQDLPLIHDATTIEQLLSHTSGIGDYLDEDDGADWADYVLAVPTHTLTTAESFLPVRGGGDGGAFTTASDMHRFWRALLAGEIVSKTTVAEMISPRCDVPDEGMRYGLGFWLHGSDDSVILEGCDAGVSFRSVHDPRRDTTATVLSNTTDGAWPLARLMAELQ